MSFILDALRKAERERNLGHVPRMEDVAKAGGPLPSSEPRGWRAVASVAIGVLLLVAVALFVLLRRPSAEPPSPAAPAVTASSVPVAAPPVPMPMPVPQASAPPRTASESAPSSPEPDTEPVDETAALVTLDDVLETEPEPVAKAPVARPQQQPAALAPASGSSSLDRETITLPAAPPAPEVSTMRLSPAPERVQRLQDMPAAFRAGFPAAAVQVHVYDPEPAKRWLLIDGHRYREGEALAQGTRIVEIRPDGVVFEQGGQRVLVGSAP